MLRKSTERKFIRSVISRVHPDLFEGHGEEQRVNTESLKELHQAVERLTEGDSTKSVDLKFYYREKGVSGAFQFVSVRLTDSLVPLYEAFGVISPEEAEDLRSHETRDTRNLEDTNFLQWLEATIQEASVTAKDLANRKEILNQLQSSITNEFKLRNIKVGCQQAQSMLSVSDVLEQIDALKIVQEALRADSDCSRNLSGLTVRVHCPRHAPVRDYHWVDYDSGKDHHICTRKWAEVSAIGEVEVVAHATGVTERLRSLDLNRARQLGAVEGFWRARQDLLARSSAEALRVKFVWPDENCTSRDFCLWAGRVLNDKVLAHELADAQFNFNLLVHSDDQAPAASFLPSSSTVQVHHHCSPRQLLELLLSNAAIAAANTSGRRIESATAEDDLLQAARDALGARHVVRICGRDKGDHVAAALRRLIQNAPTIRAAVDLQSVCLAIDDNFHLWDSGYVSIPYDFDVASVVREVTRLLAPVAPVARQPSKDLEDDAAAEAAVAAGGGGDDGKVTAGPPEAAGVGFGAGGESSSDEEVARVHAEHQSAEEFIASLKATEEEPSEVDMGSHSGSDSDGAPVATPMPPMPMTVGASEESLSAWLEGQSDFGMESSSLVAGGPGGATGPVELFGVAARAASGAEAVAPVLYPNVGSPGGSSSGSVSTGGSVGAIGGGSDGPGVVPMPRLSSLLSAAARDEVARRLGPGLPGSASPGGGDGQPADTQPAAEAPADHSASESENHREASSVPVAAIEAAGSNSDGEACLSEAEGETARSRSHSASRGSSRERGTSSEAHQDAVATAPVEPAAAAAERDDRAQEGEEDGGDFHMHVGELLKAVRLVKSRHGYSGKHPPGQQGGGFAARAVAAGAAGGGGTGDAGSAASGDRGRDRAAAAARRSASRGHSRGSSRESDGRQQPTSSQRRQPVAAGGDGRPPHHVLSAQQGRELAARGHAQSRSLRAAAAAAAADAAKAVPALNLGGMQRRRSTASPGAPLTVPTRRRATEEQIRAPGAGAPAAVAGNQLPRRSRSLSRSSLLSHSVDIEDCLCSVDMPFVEFAEHAGDGFSHMEAHSPRRARSPRHMWQPPSGQAAAAGDSGPRAPQPEGPLLPVLRTGPKRPSEGLLRGRSRGAHRRESVFARSAASMPPAGRSASLHRGVGAGKSLAVAAVRMPAAAAVGATTNIGYACAPAPPTTWSSSIRLQAAAPSPRVTATHAAMMTGKRASLPGLLFR